MCGIIGCVSTEAVAPTLLEGLKRIEYRGYDSAGIATIARGSLDVRKGVGRVDAIEKRKRLSSMEGNIGIAHTRWATHGAVTEGNAHPHTSCKGDVAVVHNGIIENYLPLKKGLTEAGHRFKSETDSEVIAHLIEAEYRRVKDPARATARATRRLTGQYALAAIFRDRPSVIVGARKDAPLVIGLGVKKNFVASDVLAFIEHTDRAVFLENHEVAEVGEEHVGILDSSGAQVQRRPTQVAWELSDISKRDYAHYTLKEIHEQVTTVANAGIQSETSLARFADRLKAADSIFIVGAGSSYHAGLLMRHRLTHEARLRCETVLAGEFREHSSFLNRDSVVLAISQSGETADLLEAVRLAKMSGSEVVSIVNAAGSSLARESGQKLLLNCGPEVGVAATKSFTAQVAVANLVVDRLVERRSASKGEELTRLTRAALTTEQEVRRIGRVYKERPDFYFIARGFHYPVALEGALKMKELSYIHAEGMAASELKHGTLALIEEGTPVVAINPTGETHGDTISSAEELKARGAKVIGVSDQPNPVYSHFVKIPKADPSVLPILETAPLQLMAYYIAVERKNDPDYPRNLAKSVTVK